MNIWKYISHKKNIKKQIYFKIIVNDSFNKWNFYVILTLILKNILVL